MQRVVIDNVQYTKFRIQTKYVRASELFKRGEDLQKIHSETEITQQS